jgi:hypothetical protein
MNPETLQRWIGNALLIIGYFVLLNVDLKLGLILKTLGGILSIPFAIKAKMWDVLIVCGFFCTIEITKLIQLFLN